MLYEFGGFPLKDKYAPVWARNDDAGGFALGSGGVFLVIESKEHAQARGAKPFARLKNVVSDRARRNGNGAVTATLEGLWTKLGVSDPHAPIITGATGAAGVTKEERDFLAHHPDHAVRATGTTFGHIMEAQFPLGLALAALSTPRARCSRPMIQPAWNLK